MIVVNINHSYAELLRRERQPLLSYEFNRITTGHWPVMANATMDGFTDYLVGTYNDMVVTAFKIVRVERVEHEGKDKLKFVVDDFYNPDKAKATFETKSEQEVDPAAWLVGAPIPGGSWRKGEARGTRRYSLDAYLKDHPDLSERAEQEFPSAMMENLFAYLRGDSRMPVQDFPALERARTFATPQPVGGVTVSRQPDGTVLIVIPSGTRAQLTVDPDRAIAEPLS